VDASPSKKSILNALQHGRLSLTGQFVHGSNYTYLARVAHEGQEYPAVYKPSRGEAPLWDFPENTLARREVAAFLISEALGWELVPPTVYRRKGPHGPGSLQLFIEHDPNYQYFTFSDSDRERLRPVALFDLVVNNADRKGGHILFDAQNHLWLIDHGLCFHVEDKLRTVVWDFAGERVPGELTASLEKLLTELGESESALERLLEELLAREEIEALVWRIRRLLENCRFPAPLANRRPYPWPPV
jgi:hypothetical protein